MGVPTARMRRIEHHTRQQNSAFKTKPQEFHHAHPYCLFTSNRPQLRQDPAAAPLALRTFRFRTDSPDKSMRSFAPEPLAIFRNACHGRTKCGHLDDLIDGVTLIHRAEQTHGQVRRWPYVAMAHATSLSLVSASSNARRIHSTKIIIVHSHRIHVLGSRYPHILIDELHARGYLPNAQKTCF